MRVESAAPSNTSVECLICHIGYKMLGSHIYKAHGIDVAEYLRRFPSAKICADATSVILSHAVTSSYEKDFTLAARKTVRLLELYHNDPQLLVRLSETRRRVQARAGLNKQISESLCRYYAVAGYDVLRAQRISTTLKALWQDEVFVAYMVRSWNRHPNESELLLEQILSTHFPGRFKFVGNSSEGNIGGRLTDFISTPTQKIVIEMFGVHWHDPLIFPNRPTKVELVRHYSTYGYKCLVLWEDVVWCSELSVVSAVEELLRG